MSATQEWHYSKNGQALGPVSTAKLKELASTSQLSPSDLIWKEGWADWKVAGTIKGLFDIQPPSRPNPPSLPTESASGSEPKRSPQTVWLGVIATIILCMSLTVRIAGQFNNQKPLKDQPIEKTGAELPARPTTIPSASPVATDTKDEIDEKRDPSVDFNKLDLEKIDYSKGPHGEPVEEKVTGFGVSRSYRGRDKKEYLHSEQIEGDAPYHVTSKYAFGVKVYQFSPTSARNAKVVSGDEWWYDGKGREKLIYWTNKNKGVKKMENHRLNGKLHGWYTDWDFDGSMNSKVRYENDEPVEWSKEPFERR